jgi:hypothetical protein
MPSGCDGNTTLVCGSFEMHPPMHGNLSTSSGPGQAGSGQMLRDPSAPQKYEHTCVHYNPRDKDFANVVREFKPGAQVCSVSHRGMQCHSVKKGDAFFVGNKMGATTPYSGGANAAPHSRSILHTKGFDGQPGTAGQANVSTRQMMASLHPVRSKGVVSGSDNYYGPQSGRFTSDHRVVVNADRGGTAALRPYTGLTG